MFMYECLYLQKKVQTLPNTIYGHGWQSSGSKKDFVGFLYLNISSNSCEDTLVVWLNYSVYVQNKKNRVVRFLHFSIQARSRSKYGRWSYGKQGLHFNIYLCLPPY